MEAWHLIAFMTYSQGFTFEVNSQYRNNVEKQ